MNAGDKAMIRSFGEPKCPKCSGPVLLMPDGAVCEGGDGLFLTIHCVRGPKALLAREIREAWPERVQVSPLDMEARQKPVKEVKIRKVTSRKAKKPSTAQAALFEAQEFE